MTQEYIDDLLAKSSGIKLDVACGANKQDPTWVGMDILPLPGVDIVWDLNVHPFPLPSGCVVVAIASHILEHIPKVAIDNGRTRFPLLEFMDDMWRIMRTGADFALAMPHGFSQGFLQDPTHVSAINENMWAYFDPGHPFYNFYRPKPWKVLTCTYDPITNIEVVLRKVEVPDG